MAKIKVLRLQNKNHGKGPYGSNVDWTRYLNGGSNNDPDFAPQDAVHHPLPEDDSKMWEAWEAIYRSNKLNSYYFGFTNIEQLRAWFYRDEWIRAMMDGRIVLTEWEVEEEDVIIGNTQLVFNRDNAELLSAVSLETLLTSNKH